MARSSRPAAGWLVAATVVAVFPANIYMALRPERLPWVPGGRATLLARLPVQGLFLALIRRVMG